MKKYYLAYDTNLCVHQMAILFPNAELAGITTLKDWRLVFRGNEYGYLTIEPFKGAEVPAAVWEISERDERYLDNLEGFPEICCKRTLPVVLENTLSGESRAVEAMAYVLNVDRPLCIPSREYLDICITGYRDFGFDLARLREAMLFVGKEA